MRKPLLRLTARFGVLLGGLGLSLVFGAASASAANITWVGPDGGDLQTAANWSTSTVPTSADTAVFDVSTLTSNNTLANSAPFDVASLSFIGSNLNTGYTFNGSAISISGGISQGATGSGMNFNAPITLTSSQSFTGTGGLILDVVNLGAYDLSIGTSYYYPMGSSSGFNGSGNITFLNGAGGNLPDASPSWTGNLIINTGASVAAKDGGSLGHAAGTVTIASGGVLRFCAPNGATVNQSFTIGGTGMSGEGAISPQASCSGPLNQPTDNGNVTLAGSITLTANTTIGANDTVTVTGALSGAYTLTAAPGSGGTLVINSSNNTSSTPNGSAGAPVTSTTYAANSPSTSITLGTNQTGIVTGTYGDVIVASGTLKGTGTIGNLTMTAGMVAPGMSPGVLNAGNTSFSGGTFQEELGGTTPGTYDQLNVTGTVDLGADVTTLDTSLYGSFTPAAGDSFIIINNDLADAVTGTFKNLAEGATFTVSGYVFKISYVGGDGNDVVLTTQSVPALPATGFSLGLGNVYLMLLSIIAMAGSLIGAAWYLSIKHNRTV